MQQQWGVENLSEFGYDPNLVPTITIETGSGKPHSAISAAQNARRSDRVKAGEGKWSSTLAQELRYIVDNLTEAGFSTEAVNAVLEQQYKMLDL